MEPPSSAFYDLYYLLARGYSRSHALELIRLKHGLGREAAILLSRCIHPPEINNEIREKKQEAQAIKNSCLVIDGFNQLTTIYAALTSKPLYLCSDTMLRDALLAGPKLVVKNIEPLATLLGSALARLAPRSAIVVLDSQPSHSGETAAYLRKKLGIEAIVSPHADKEVIILSQREDCVVATSDIAITLKVQRVFDLAYYVATTLLRRSARINNIPHLLREEHHWWCQSQAGP